MNRMFCIARAFLTASLLMLFLHGTLLLSSCKKPQVPLIEEKCGTCHSADIVYQTRRSEEDWRRTVHGMKIRGMKITEEEERQIFEVLFRDFLLE